MTHLRVGTPLLDVSGGPSRLASIEAACDAAELVLVPVLRDRAGGEPRDDASPSMRSASNIRIGALSRLDPRAVRREGPLPRGPGQAPIPIREKP